MQYFAENRARCMAGMEEFNAGPEHSGKREEL